MDVLKERPQDWNIGWCTIQIECTNWAVIYNGYPVESEFASERDAWDKAYLWEAEMAEQWRWYA